MSLSAESPSLPGVDQPPPGVDQAAFRETLSHLSAGVVVVTANWRGTLHAMTATAFCSVSLDPPLVLVSVSKTSRFHGALLGADRWAASIMSAQQAPVARHFSTPGRDLATQFDGVPHGPAPVTGAPVIDGSLAWLDCETEAVHSAGDHTLVIGLVRAAGVAANAGSEDLPVQSLSYYRSQYRGLP